MVEQSIENYSKITNNNVEMIGNYAKKIIKMMMDNEKKEQQHKDKNNVSKKKT